MESRFGAHELAVMGSLFVCMGCLQVLRVAWLHVELVQAAVLAAGAVALLLMVGHYYWRRLTLRRRYLHLLDEGVRDLRSEGKLVGRSLLVDWLKARASLEHVADDELGAWIDAESRARWYVWYGCGGRIRPSVVRIPRMRRLAKLLAGLWGLAALASCFGRLPFSEVPARSDLIFVEATATGLERSQVAGDTLLLLTLSDSRPAGFAAVSPIGELVPQTVHTGSHVVAAVARESVGTIPWRLDGSRWGDAWAVWSDGLEVASYERSRFDFVAFGAALLLGGSCALALLLLASRGERMWSLDRPRLSLVKTPPRP